MFICWERELTQWRLIFWSSSSVRGPKGVAPRAISG